MARRLLLLLQDWLLHEGMLLPLLLRLLWQGLMEGRCLWLQCMLLQGLMEGRALPADGRSAVARAAARAD